MLSPFCCTGAIPVQMCIRDRVTLAKRYEQLEDAQRKMLSKAKLYEAMADAEFKRMRRNKTLDVYKRQGGIITHSTAAIIFIMPRRNLRKDIVRRASAG